VDGGWGSFAELILLLHLSLLHLKLLELFQLLKLVLQLVLMLVLMALLGVVGMWRKVAPSCPPCSPYPPCTLGGTVRRGGDRRFWAVVLLERSSTIEIAPPHGTVWGNGAPSRSHSIIHGHGMLLVGGTRGRAWGRLGPRRDRRRVWGRVRHLAGRMGVGMVFGSVA